jgi:signal transduction histidine kinase
MLKLEVVEEEEYRRQFRLLPFPALVWRKLNGSFLLEELNNAADFGTTGKTSVFRGMRAEAFYPGNPEIIRMLHRSLEERKRFEMETVCPGSGEGKQRRLHLTFVFGAPDLVFVYPEDITSRKEQEEKLLACRSSLRSVAADLSLAEECERRMIAADIHDCVNQTLAMVQIKLEELEEGLRESPRRNLVQEVRELITEAIRGARNLSFELCPPILHEQGIIAATKWLTEHFQAETGICSRFESASCSARLAADIETLLYKSLRELLYNIRKHAGADHAGVSVWNDTSYIYIRVEDDGKGFDTSGLSGSAKRKGGFGLFSIRERLRYVGGDCTIESVLSQGTRCTVFAPLGKCS